MGYHARLEKVQTILSCFPNALIESIQGLEDKTNMEKYIAIIKVDPIIWEKYSTPDLLLNYYNFLLALNELNSKQQNQQIKHGTEDKFKGFCQEECTTKRSSTTCHFPLGPSLLNLDSKEFVLLPKGKENILLLVPFSHITNFEFIKNYQLYSKEIIKCIKKINESFEKEMINSISFNLGCWQTQAIRNDIQNCHGHVRLEINPEYFDDFEKTFHRKIRQVSHFKDDIDAMDIPVTKVLNQFNKEIIGIKKEIIGIKKEIGEIRLVMLLNFLLTFLILYKINI